LKDQSNSIDHGPAYPAEGRRIWTSRNDKIRFLRKLKKYRLAQKYAKKFGYKITSFGSAPANTLLDNDDIKLQDLSFRQHELEKQHNNDYNNGHYLKARIWEKKKQTQGKNSNHSDIKEGKKKKTDVIDDRKKHHSKSYIKNMKKAYIFNNEKKVIYDQKYKHDKKIAKKDKIVKMRP
jgi:hypothetical protein